MNAIGADQNIAAHGVDMAAGSSEEIGGYPTLVLGEGAEPAAGVDRILTQSLLDGAVDHALQPAAMDRELWHVVGGIHAAHVAPDFLAVAVEIIKHVGADRDVIELLQEAEAGEFADRMRQRVDADAELPDRIRLLEQFTPDAAGAQHQRRGKAADAATDDNRLHRFTPLTTRHFATTFNVARRLTQPQAALSPPP